MTKKDEQALARQMRLAGRTYDDIAADLGISKGTCSAWLRGLPQPAEGAEAQLLPLPTDGDDGRPVVQEARRMRAEGRFLREIAEVFGVTVKSASVWCAGMAWPPRARQGGGPEHMEMTRRAYWDAELAARDAARRARKAASAQRVGQMRARDLELAAVATYWCEGVKDKSYARRETLSLINSDPGVILLWSAYLDQLDVPQERRRYALSIHESADVQAAQQWRADLVGVPVPRFNKTTLKRHNPRTVRKNTGRTTAGASWSGCCRAPTSTGTSRGPGRA